MIRLRFASLESAPSYATAASAGADLRAHAAMTIMPRARARIPTGVWIESVDWPSVPAGMIPELQIRARSGLAFKYGVGLPNGVGTIDADYREEIGVLLVNHGDEPFVINVGDRIAQMVLALTYRIPGLAVHGERTGGFGSTGV